MKFTKKKKKSNLTDERCYRLLSRRIPQAIPALKNLAKAFEDFDPALPQTHKAKMEQIFADFVESTKGQERFLKKILRLFLRRIPAASIVVYENLSEVTKMVKSQAQKDQRYSLLLKLLKEVDQASPFASTVAIFRHADPRLNLLPQSSPLPALQRAESLIKGEKRKDAVLEAFRLTVEHLYKPYIETLWMLAYYKNGDIPPNITNLSGKKPEFGHMLQVAAEKLSNYPGLIELKIGWLRNSVTHDLPVYHISSDAIELQDARRKTVLIKVDELLDLTKSLYQISAGTIVNVSQLYMFRDLLLETGILDVFVEHLSKAFTSDDEELAKFDQVVTKDIQNIIMARMNGTNHKNQL